MMPSLDEISHCLGLSMRKWLMLLQNVMDYWVDSLDRGHPLSIAFVECIYSVRNLFMTKQVAIHMYMYIHINAGSSHVSRCYQVLSYYSIELRMHGENQYLMMWLYLRNLVKNC